MKGIIKWCRAMLCLAVLAAMGIAGIAGTYAWDTHKTAQENNLQSKNIRIGVEEVFWENVFFPGITRQKIVWFRNRGTSPVFLRVVFAENWMSGRYDTDENRWLITGDTGVIKNWTPAWKSQWELKSDGWYYYKKVLPAGGRTDAILDSLRFPDLIEGTPSYSLEFLVEAVQVSDEASVNTSATTEVFGMAATVTGMQTAYGTVTAGDVSWD